MTSLIYLCAVAAAMTLDQREASQTALELAVLNRLLAKIQTHSPGSLTESAGQVNVAQQQEVRQEAEDRAKEAAYQREEASAAEMREQQAAMQQQLQQSGGAAMIESPAAIQQEVSEHMRELSGQRRFGEDAEQTLAALRAAPTVPMHAAALASAARQSQRELAQLTQATEEQPLPSWHD